MTLKQFFKLNEGEIEKAELNFAFSKAESDLLEKFSFEEIKGKDVYRWDCILNSIADSIKQSPITFLTNITLNNLIKEKAILNSLAHMDLDNYWLLKIYEKDTNNFEALIKVYKRIIGNGNLEFLKFLLYDFKNDFVLCYSLIELLKTRIKLSEEMANIMLSYIDKKSPYYDLINKYISLFKSKLAISSAELKKDILDLLDLQNQTILKR